jgi:hypothetical protein
MKILIRAKTNGVAKDYIRINGTPYVVGESAERHCLVSKRSGASRYTRDYYGVLTVKETRNQIDKGLTFRGAQPIARFATLKHFRLLLQSLFGKVLE